MKALIAVAALVLVLLGGLAFVDATRSDFSDPGGSPVGGIDTGADPATVSRVIDGDTLDVLIGGEPTRIRLLNIDTPETKKAGSPVECLGPEASAFLEELLPEGTEVILEYDATVTDQYGRTVAGVYLDDALVNAEIARAGLARTVVFDGNDRFLDEVRRAEREADASDRGLFDQDRCPAG